MLVQIIAFCGNDVSRSIGFVLPTSEKIEGGRFDDVFEETSEKDERAYK
jgi:hypothetical protein